MAGRSKQNLKREKVPERLPRVVDPSDGLPIVEGDELPLLTEQQFEFVGLIASGMPRMHAYRKAYPDAKVKDTWAMSQAAKLLKREDVKAWLSALNEARLVSYLGTANDYVAECRGLMEEAKKAGNHNAAIRAQELVGKAEGHFDRGFVSVEQRADGDLVKTAHAVLGPEGQRRIMEMLGISGQGDSE